MPGPSVAGLTRRVAETPKDFLADPAVISVAAIVGDLFDARLTGPQEDALRHGDRGWLRCVAVASWLLAGVSLDAALAWAFLAQDLRLLSGQVTADELVDDPDHREELVRRALHGLGVVPDGETQAQADDRRQALDSVERARLFELSKTAEARAAEVRQAMHEQAAAEAASKGMRE